MICLYAPYRDLSQDSDFEQLVEIPEPQDPLQRWLVDDAFHIRDNTGHQFNAGGAEETDAQQQQDRMQFIKTEQAKEDAAAKERQAQMQEAVLNTHLKKSQHAALAEAAKLDLIADSELRIENDNNAGEDIRQLSQQARDLAAEVRRYLEESTESENPEQGLGLLAQAEDDQTKESALLDQVNAKLVEASEPAPPSPPTEQKATTTIRSQLAPAQARPDVPAQAGPDVAEARATQERLEQEDRQQRVQEDKLRASRPVQQLSETAESLSASAASLLDKLESGAESPSQARSDEELVQQDQTEETHVLAQVDQDLAEARLKKKKPAAAALAPAVPAVVQLVPAYSLSQTTAVPGSNTVDALRLMSDNEREMAESSEKRMEALKQQESAISKRVSASLNQLKQNAKAIAARAASEHIAALSQAPVAPVTGLDETDEDAAALSEAPVAPVTDLDETDQVAAPVEATDERAQELAAARTAARQATMEAHQYKRQLINALRRDGKLEAQLHENDPKGDRLASDAAALVNDM